MPRISSSMIVPLIVASALFMENLDGTIITTALPEMAVSFGTSAIHLSIGITAYMLSLAIFIPASGWVADRFGARTVFRTAIVVFTLGSMLCGLCNGTLELAAARILQGVGGAMMVPVGRLIMLRSVEKSELVRAMAYLTVPALIGPVLGPPVGGFITTYASWRWIFFLNLPIGILGFVLVTRLIENTKEPDTPALDWSGFLLTGLSLGCLVYDFDLMERPEAGAAMVLALLGISLAAGLMAAWHLRRHQHPLLDPNLFRISSFAETACGGTVFRVGSGALAYLLPILFQIGFGMTAFASGLLTLGAALGSFAMKISARKILRRWGFRRVLLVNGIISAASILVCVFFTATTPAALIVASLLVGGFFRSLQYTSLNTIAFADIPPPRMSAAASLSSMLQQVSNGMSVAVAAVILHAALLWRGAAGEPLAAADIQLTLIAAALITLASCLFFARLASDAGAEVSGHRRHEAAPSVENTVTATGD